jgi:hypothetical protein
MTIRQDFDSLPPKMFLHQILDKIAKTYVFLWDRQDEEHKIRLSWKDISVHYNKNSFRSCLRKLNGEGLLSYTETVEGLIIELVGYDDIEDE